MSFFKSERNKVRSVPCKKAVQLLCVTFGVLLLCVPAFSQGNSGRILGTVFDQSGGIIAGATVSVVDVDRGVTRTLTTDDAGEYNAPNLIPGKYTIRGESKGFQKLERQNVVIEVGKEIRVDLTLQAGAQEQTVTVTEEAPQVDTTTATLGGTVENKAILDMPLNGRNFQNLMPLRPGTLFQVGGGPSTQSTNGTRSDESVWMIDGIINWNFADNRPIVGMQSPLTDAATILPIDSIQEFNMMENPKAEYGWKPGAIVNVGIKSGSNTFHGSAYMFYRSSAWDARNYFNIDPYSNGTCAFGAAAFCAKVPTQLKQFGGSIGGPIKKDKLFFFANYEGLRDLIGNVFGTSGVPETGPSSGNSSLSQAENMSSALSAVIAAGLTPSPVSLKLAGCSLGPPVTCTGGFYPNNPSNSTAYLSTFPNINTSDNGVAKIDYHINDKNTINGDFLTSRYLGTGEDHPYVNVLFTNGFPITTYTASGNWDYIPNSRIVNEVRFGYNRESLFQTSNDANIVNPINTGSLIPGLPDIDVSFSPLVPGSFNQLGTTHNRPQNNHPDPYWDALETFSYLAGKHSFKFGVEIAHMEADVDTPDYGRGDISFLGGGIPTTVAAFNCPPPKVGSCSSGLEDMFAGYPTRGKYILGNPNRSMISKDMAAFAQDDWRITPKLTLNLGLRYSYQTPFRDVNNLLGNFDPTSPTGLIQQGQLGHSTVYNADKDDFSPRFGFAYDVNGKGTTVVRGGFSVIYSTFSTVLWFGQQRLQDTSSTSLGADPTSANFIVNGVSTPGAGSIAVGAFVYNASQLCWDPTITASCATSAPGQATVFPKGSAGITCGDGGADGSPCSIMGVDPNLKTPYVINYNLGVTHAFSSNLSLDLSYIGNHGGDLLGIVDLNQCGPNNPLDGGKCIRPYASKFPYFSFINEMSNDERSNYNGLQATLTKRLSHGVSFLLGYTYSHSLDSGSLNRFALLPPNTNNPGAEYGSGDFDVRHRLTLTTTYNIPGINGFAQMFKGWQLNAIVTIQSPQPWLVNDYSDNFSGNGDSADRWDFFGNPSDFKGTQTSIPYCSGFSIAGGTTDTNGYVTGGAASGAGAKCSQTSGAYGTSITPASSSALIANCLKDAPDPNTLKAGGCFASGNSVMAPPVAGTFGTMGRNIFRDSGYRNLDFSVFKSFSWKERYSAQLRLEVFNLFNHPVPENPYGSSNGSTGSNNDPSQPSAFGSASGTPDVIAGNPVVGSGDAREVQIGVKFTF